jgi:hypothetical protein
VLLALAAQRMVGLPQGVDPDQPGEYPHQWPKCSRSDESSRSVRPPQPPRDHWLHDRRPTALDATTPRGGRPWTSAARWRFRPRKRRRPQGLSPTHPNRRQSGSCPPRGWSPNQASGDGEQWEAISLLGRAAMRGPQQSSRTSARPRGSRQERMPLHSLILSAVAFE